MQYTCGRWRAEEVKVKTLKDGSRLVFFDEQKIYLFPVRGNGTAFHRWGAGRGFYLNSWKLFRQKLMKYRRLSYLKCFEIAAEHEVGSLGVYRTIAEITEGREVKEI